MIGDKKSDCLSECAVVLDISNKEQGSYQGLMVHL